MNEPNYMNRRSRVKRNIKKIVGNNFKPIIVNHNQLFNYNNNFHYGFPCHRQQSKIAR
jgi:hypothetical protein